MRKIVLTTAALALVGLSGPAFADMTLPSGAYSQAEASTGSGSEPAYRAFDATVEQPARYLPGHHVRAHRPVQR